MTKTKLQIMREKAEYDIGELADIVSPLIEKTVVKGLRFDQINALTIMYEFGHIKFSDDLLKVYSQALGCSVDELVEE
ncbi:helix-turn-helix transcriptional regulator [Lactococcus formosensis]|uniref:helix-turn-helix domain-containing protein n=1 Tax=Lactococcus formosensis TaxID=1281486 RepID=UPI001F05F7D1|nr:helix-turn-helix transcriptional regulator [Lactococcus formosensis]MCH1723591.1 helix-turn-helix transcriptional regulator [Lactococcus formosensis]